MNTHAVSLPSVRDKQHRFAWLFASCLLLAVSITPSVRAVTGTLSGLTDDAQANRLAGANSTAGDASSHCRIGNNSADDQQMSVVHVFEIPPAVLADPTQRFDTATYTARLSGKLATTRNADLYGLGYRTTPAVLPSDFYAGASDGAATPLKDNFLVPSMTAPSLIVEPGAALTAYLNAQLSAARLAGAATAYVFLRTNIDAIGNYQYYQLGMANGGAGNTPTIAYSTITVPQWVQVPLGGGGCVNGLVSNSTGTDIYCRTDVGTAFRWVPAADGNNGQWLSITDTIVPTGTTGASGLACTAAIAVNPNDSNKLYVAVGSNFAPMKGIYESTNRGDSWTAINTTFAINGNGTFNGFGERLQVDPNNSNILWYGSTDDGLQKGVKTGSTWAWTQIPATSVPFGNNNSAYNADNGKAGVTFVACDPNGGSTILYAGVYDSLTSTGGVYRSINGGTDWDKVPGVAVAMPNRAQVAPDGTLYVTALNVVAKMARGGSLMPITPGGAISYRGLAVDPNDSTGQTVYVAHRTGEKFAKIWRTTDGGDNWALQSTNFNEGRTIPRSEPDGTPSVTGYWLGSISSLLVTPGNDRELWAGDFFGVARTRNAHQLGGGAGSQAIWYMLQRNQDETCVEAIKNAPTGPELMVATADVGGFRYNDISQRPYGAYGNIFTNPGDANVNSLDFCESNHNIWARTWTGNTPIGSNTGDFFGSGGYSRDGGVSWYAFGEIIRKDVSSGAAGLETWDLTTYLAAQKAKGVNTVTLLVSTFRATNNSGAVLSFASKENPNAALRPYLLVNGSSSVVPVADVTAFGGDPTTNYGSEPTLGTSWYWGYTVNERHIYLKFDLSGLPAITSATLNLNRVAAAAGITYPVTVFACADTSWNESTLAWTGRPLPYANADSALLYSASPRYRTAAGAYLSGGRVAVSSKNPNLLVWMPFRKKTPPLDDPHYSNDAGVTWTPCVGLPSGIMLLKGKSNPGYLIQQLSADRADANGSFYMMQPNASSGSHYIFKSTNGGANWSHAGTIPFSGGAQNVYRVQIVAAPAAGHVWVCDDGVNGTTDGGLWKSTTGGTGTWNPRLADIRAVRQVSFGKPPAGSLYPYSVYFHGYYKGAKGIFRSDDEGLTWNALPALPSIISIESLAGDRQIPGGVFIGTGGRGVFQYQP